jgi:hypothetical protein
VTAVDALKGPDCGDATEETERMPSLRSQNMLMKILMTKDLLEHDEGNIRD